MSCVTVPGDTSIPYFVASQEDKPAVMGRDFPTLVFKTEALDKPQIILSSLMTNVNTRRVRIPHQTFSVSAPSAS